MGYDDRYDPDADFDRWYTKGTARAISTWLRPGDEVLELGCASGLMTADLVTGCAAIVGVDRSALYLDRARARALDAASFVECEVTALELNRTFDHVIAANIVHEVPNPGDLFTVAARHLRPGGHLHITAPNPRSLHRLLGIEMGMLADSASASERAASLETLHLLDADDLERLGAAVGLSVAHSEGVMLKPFPNDQMAELAEPLLEALLRAAQYVPGLCAMNYLVLR